MAAGAVGADQHQRPDGIPGGALDVGGRDVDAAALRLRFHFIADGLADFGPIAIKGGNQIAALRHRPAGFLPGRTAGVLFDVAGVVLQALEEGLPFGIDRGRIGLVAGIEVIDIGGITAIEERGERKSGIRILARHET